MKDSIEMSSQATEATLSNTSDGLEALSSEALRFIEAGDEFFKRKDYYEAEKAYKKAIAMHPDAKIVKTKLTDCHYYQGMLYFQAASFKEAIKPFKKALSFTPNHSQALANLGYSYYGVVNYKAALEFVNQAIALNDKDPKFYRYRALINYEKKQYQSAIDDNTTALTLDPNHVATLNQRGTCYRELGNFTQALGDFNKALALKPNNIAVLNSRFILYRDKMEDDKAAKADEQAITNVQNLDAEGYYQRGCFYFHSLKKYSLALENLTNAIALNPLDLKSHLLRQQVCDKMHHTAGTSHAADLIHWVQDLYIFFKNSDERRERLIAKINNDRFFFPSISSETIKRAQKQALEIESQGKDLSTENNSETDNFYSTNDTLSQGNLSSLGKKRERESFAAASSSQSEVEESWLEPVKQKAQSAASTEAISVLEEIRCAITGAIMQDPVIASDGHTYEKEAIEHYMTKSPVSPLTQAPFEHKHLVPNLAIKSIISKHLERNSLLHKDLYFSQAIKNQALTAIKNNHIERLKELIQQEERLLTQAIDADDIKPTSLLMLVCQYGNGDLLHTVLSEYRQKMPQRQEEIQDYFKAIYQNPLLQANAVLQLLQCIPGQEKHYDQLLTFFIEKQDVEPAKWCAARVKNINTLSETGRTFLHRAVQLGALDLTQLLLEKGIDLSLPDKTGKLAIHYAAETGHREIARLLLSSGQEQGVNIMLLDKDHKTPKQIAEERGFDSLLELFNQYAFKEYQREVKWVTNFSLFYKKEKHPISGECHNQLRALTEGKQRDGNVVHAHLTFFFKIKHELFKNDPYKTHAVLVSKLNASAIHVDTEYGKNQAEFVKDLKRYHPEESQDIEKMHRENTQEFPRKFHHSERAIFKYLEKPEVIAHYAHELANTIQAQYQVEPKDIKVIAVILDMHSTRYLCDWCEPATHHFQSPQSLFMRMLKKELEKIHFTTSKKHDLYMLTRYSAEMPAGDKPAKKASDHAGMHITHDIKSLRKDGISLILQRDNVKTHIEAPKATAGMSRQQEAHTLMRRHSNK